MKAVLQKIPRATNASSILLDRRLDDSIPFQWHHHPEFELTLTLNSRGQRFIGDHIGAYDDGDLVLVGSNLPHTWHSSSKIEEAQPHVALVLWFHPEWVERLDEGFVELEGVKAMFERSAPGLQFSTEVAARLRPLFEGLRRLAPEERLPDVLSLLTILAREQLTVPLSSRVVTPSGRSVDRGRLDRVLDHIHLNYAENPSMDELADLAALSLSGLHRLFLRHLNMPVSEYLMRLRIGEACALLTGSGRSIAHIAEAVGYHSIANFNRQFKVTKGMTPRQFRNRFHRGV
ncbi:MULTISPECIES: AraC family transcriptional regulator [unclassified Ensifer]|uniref:helix-turn-helix domain-containing protein n=1 Tax=unclassified Ensifer TaxID=2633371 RepID=UPI0008137674|nr:MULTISPECIES: AraC family transcriptional regulator [unclassified Ensifer]OCO98173.1 transcriptional regulator [Ensifer sp. LC14]OCP03815.1 transcriptional regulator [Ensifer sp. LC11]OCP04211.1 transcriptional regulator [Ensifer sp. LC13]OCP30345.1 transcriptional regulator [Ensifer sp. LC499]